MSSLLRDDALSQDDFLHLRESRRETEREREREGENDATRASRRYNDVLSRLHSRSLNYRRALITLRLNWPTDPPQLREPREKIQISRARPLNPADLPALIWPFAENLGEPGLLIPGVARKRDPMARNEIKNNPLY